MLQDFVQQVNDSMKYMMSGIHTAVPATIVSFDSGSGLATVLPTAQLRKPDGEAINYPQITGVPVIFSQSMGQQAAIGFPIKAGDGCLLIFAEQSNEYWLYGRQTPTDLSFDLSNAIAIYGCFNTSTDAIKEACENNAIVINVQGTKIRIKKDEVKVDSKQVIINCTQTTINGNLRVNGNMTLANGTGGGDGTATFTGRIIAEGDIIGGGISLDNHTHTGVHGETSSAH